MSEMKRQDFGDINVELGESSSSGHELRDRRGMKDGPCFQKA